MDKKYGRPHLNSQQKTMRWLVVGALCFTLLGSARGGTDFITGSDAPFYYYNSVDLLMLSPSVEFLPAAEGGAWDARTAPVNLGTFPYECKGDITKCNSISVSFWMSQPANGGDPQVPERYLISNGGQSAASNGVYVKQNFGKDYEVAVGIGDKKWTVSFFLAQPDAAILKPDEVHMLFGFDGQALNAYVDGVLAGSDTTGTTRLWTQPELDMFQMLTLGMPNDDVVAGTYPDITISSVKIYENDVPWEAHFRELDDISSKFSLGCAGNIPPTSVPQVASVLDCRIKCHRQHYYVALWNADTKKCFCQAADDFSKSSETSDCTFGYVASHALDSVEFDMNLKVTIQLPSTKGYILPRESVTLNFENTYVGTVTYTITFGDGYQRVTTDSSVSYAWEAEGDYSVTVRAEARHSSQEWTENFKIENVAEGVAPERLSLVGFPDETGGMGDMIIYISAFSTTSSTCRLDFGDGSTQDFSNTLANPFIVNEAIFHNYAGQGVYIASLSCDNQFGQSSTSGPVFVADSILGWVNQDAAQDIIVSVVGLDHLEIYMDGVVLDKDLAPQIAGGGGILLKPNLVFSSMGCHLVEIIGSVDGAQRPILRTVYDVRGVISGPALVAVDQAANTVASALNFDLSLAEGDLVDVRVDWGDDTVQYLHITHGGADAKVTLEHTWMALGHYEVKATFANLVSQSEVTLKVYIERQIQEASMTAENVTSPDTSVCFIFKVDQQVTPAMPFVADFYYGDGTEETVELGIQDPLNPPSDVTHCRAYSDWGIYNVQVMVCNHLPDCQPIQLTATVMVGEFLECVDVVSVSNDGRVSVGEEVEIKIRTCGGSPIHLTVQYGDGTTEQVGLPEDYRGVYTPSTESGGASTDNGPGIEGSGDLSNSDMPIVDEGLEVGNNTLNVRKRRMAVDDNTENPSSGDGETGISVGNGGTSDETPTSYPEFTLTHTYARAGAYSVSVSVQNMWGKHDTVLCPAIQVVDNDLPQCDQFDVSLVSPYTEAAPQVVKRAQEVTIGTSSTLSCDWPFTYSAAYDWKVEKWDDYRQMYRPETEVCVGNQEGNLVISGNTLWYGSYRITGFGYGSVENGGDPAGGAVVPGTTIIRSQTVLTTYLKVVASDLVAQFTPPTGVSLSGDKYPYTKHEVITLNLESSGDPDVAANNKSGVTIHVIAFRDMDSQYSTMSLAALLPDATQLATSAGLRPKTTFYTMADVFTGNAAERVTVISGVVSFPAEICEAVNLNLKIFVLKDERVSAVTFPITIRQITEDTTADQVLSAAGNMLARGDFVGCLTVLTAGADAVLNNDEESEDDEEAQRKREQEQKDMISMASKATQLAPNTGVVGLGCKAVTTMVRNPQATTADAKDDAAKALLAGADRTAEVAEDADLGEVADTGNAMLSGLQKVQPTNENQMKKKRRRRKRRSVDDDPLQFSGSGSGMSEAEQEESCCEKPYLEAHKAFGEGEWWPPKTFCEWIETEQDLMDYVAENPQIFGTRDLEDIVLEYELKDVEWSEEVCNQVDQFTRDDEFKPMYIAWAARKQKEDFAKRKATNEKCQAAADGISDVVMNKQGDGEDTVLGDASLNMAVIKLGKENKGRLRRSADGKSYTVGQNGPSLPASVVDNASGMKEMNMANNPFTYSAGTPADKMVNGPVNSIDMKGPDGKTVTVSDTSEPIIVRRPFTADQLALMEPKMIQIINADHIHYETAVTENNNTRVLMQIIPVGENDIFGVFVKRKETEVDWPNQTYYDYTTTIPRPSEDYIGDNYDVQKFIVHVPYNLTAQNGTIRFAIIPLDYRVKNGEQQSVNFTTLMWYASCRFFNLTTNLWEDGGMNVTDDSDATTTVCSTNHLTSFGGDFVVPPNTIDFKTVFSAEKFLESMPVFCTVIIVMLIYVGGLVWARHMDKKDLLKWGASPLEDNLPTDNYHYQITVNTGVRKNAQTSSRVSFILSGDDSDTGVRRLYDGKRKELPAGSIYNYILSTEQCLGPLTYMRIWHDNSGKGKTKGWYLDQIQLTDLQNGDRFFFLCDRWMAVEEDDGMVERILPVAGLSDLSAFKHLFSTSVRKKLTNDHLWVSVLSRPTRSNFTRVQRISCCVALLFLTMITNCMFFKADEKAENVSAVSIGPFSFTLHQLFISVVTTLIVFPPSLAIVTIFRKAKPKKNSIMQMNQSLSQKSKKFRWRTFNPGSSLWTNVEKTRMQKFKDSMRNIMNSHSKQKYEADPEEHRQVTGTKKKKKGWSLPHWTMYVAWVLVFFSVVASGFFTILYSMEWGREKSLDWLSTFILSFFQSVIVVQPIKVLLLAAFVSCIMRKPDLDNEEDDFDDANAGPSAMSNMTSSQKDLQEIIKQRQLAATEVQPPDTAALEIAREKRMKEIQMESILKECIVYIFFIIVLFFLSYQARDADSFTMAQNIKDQFRENSPRFDGISTPNGFWNWCYKTLLPNLYSGEWYNGRPLNWREALQVSDQNTIRVGVGRFRQLRIKEDSCDIQTVFEKTIKHCREQYNWVDDDTKDFLSGWVKPPPNNNSAAYHDAISPWVYRSSVELKNAPYAGLLTLYKGGGYTFNFRRSAQKTERLMRRMEKLEWVDVRTRAIFVEFTLYNANVNLFASVIMGLEFMATGAAISKTDVKIFRLSSYVGGFGIIVIFFELVYLGFTLFFFGKMCKDLKKQKMKYFKDFWNMLEFATLILSLVAIVMYAMKKVFGTVAIKVLHESGAGEYVNFVTISIWDGLFGFILAMVVFLATLKFIKMLRFNKRMGMLGDTIRLASKDLKYFMVTFFIYFFAFCQWAYLMFGSQLPSYGSFIGSAEALFAFALGDFDFYEFQDAQRTLGPLFFLFYVGIVYVALMGMFLSILYDAFASVKADADLRSNDYEIVDFVWKKFRGVFGWGGQS